MEYYSREAVLKAVRERKLTIKAATKILRQLASVQSIKTQLRA